VSWVKLGPEGAAAALRAGANDLGGVLMNESITRAAGARHGQEMSPAELDGLVRRLGREPRQRTTLYGTPPPERRAAALAASPIADIEETPLGRRQMDVAAAQ
jgi:FO synthase